MTRSEVIEISKQLSKISFKFYLKDQDIDISDEDIIIMGFKEFEKHFVVLLAYSKLKNKYCEMTFGKESKSDLKIRMFKLDNEYKQ